jgi:hypothetical protein
VEKGIFLGSRLIDVGDLNKVIQSWTRLERCVKNLPILEGSAAVKINPIYNSFGEIVNLEIQYFLGEKKELHTRYFSFEDLE